MNPICSICLLDLLDGNESNATQCGHIFHRGCIGYSLHKLVYMKLLYILSLEFLLQTLWVIFVCLGYYFRKSVCPVCRVDVDRRKLLTLFFSTNDATNTTTSTGTTAKATPSNVTPARPAHTAAPAVAAVATTSATSVNPIQPQRIMRRRPTQHFNYTQLNCLLCHSKFITASDYVICDSCLHKKWIDFSHHEN